MGADGSLRHPYFRAFDRQLRTYRRRLALHDLVAAAARADIVYVGDFHAEPAFQRSAADLLSRLAPRVPGLSLGVEFFFTRQQHLLDRRQQGLLEDDSLLERTHYDEEWGYPWEGYRCLLDRARENDVPVHALDVPPRSGLASLRRRDDHAARRITDLLRREPDRRLMVLFGESHLARGHLPRRVKARLKQAGLERREIVVFQSPDRLYWQLLGAAGPVTEAVHVGAESYAVFPASPLQKYEAYRQVLERWRDDAPADEEVDLAPAVHHLIDVLLGWLGIRAARRRIQHQAGWSEDLIDAFPEVYGGVQAEQLIEPLLAEQGRRPDEVDDARLRLQRRGALYEARSNTLFLRRYLPGPAAGEAARFIRTALTGGLFAASSDFAGDPPSRAYGAAYNEGLAYLGSKLIDPTGEELDRALTRNAPRGDAKRWLDAHHRYERSSRVTPPADLLDPLARSRKLRRTLAHDLGRRLGRALFDRVRRGRLDRRKLARLFQRPLGSATAPQAVVRFQRPLQAATTAQVVVRLLRGVQGS